MSEKGKSGQSSEPGGKNILTAPRATLIAAIIAASVTAAGIYFNKRSDSLSPPKPTPSPTQAAPLAVEITHLDNGQDLEATREAGHNSAHFKVPVLVSGESTTPDLGVYILVLDRGTWEIQRDAIAVKASKGYYEIDAWSGGGSKENRTKEGQSVQLKAIVADINKVSAYAPDGTKQVSEDAKEVSPASISPIAITVKVRPIRAL